MTKPGKVILLNGASSAGKSSVARRLQKLFLPNPLLFLGIDDFMHFLPQDFFAIEPLPDQPAYQGLRWVLPIEAEQTEKVRKYVNENSHNHLAKYEKFVEALNELELYETVTSKGIQIVCGPAIQRVIEGMHASIAQLARLGNDVVVEHVFLDTHWRDSFLNALSDIPIISVGLKCPIVVLEKREIERGHRIVGQSRGHYITIHEDMRYDLEFDTSVLDATECAEHIKSFLDKKQN